jgi:Ser/Thr protein kinase RdoA (MazF antagonist)
VSNNASTLRVHGLVGDLVSPDWAPISDAEAQKLVARYGWREAHKASVVWRSPRPLSAAAIIVAGDRRALLKRHDRRVRTVVDLQLEHRFALHLDRAGVPTPRPLVTREGSTVVADVASLYELQTIASGIDLYRDAPSWTGYRTKAHARAAGATLARFHDAAEDFVAPARVAAVLTDSCQFAAAVDPIGAIADHVARRPGLAATLSAWPWKQELADALAPGGSDCDGRQAACAVIAALPRRWGHGDWHPSNLTWTSGGPEAGVATVLDLGLANLTNRAWDLAIAVERGFMSWLASGEDGRRVAIDLSGVEAFLASYGAQRPQSRLEILGVAALLPVVHVAFALSEIEYFGEVLHSLARARIAYHDYLLGHLRWFQSADGVDALARLRSLVGHTSRTGLM